MDVLELIRAGLLDPEPEVPQSDADLEAEWGNYAVAEDPLVGPGKDLRKDVLAQIASRYFPVPIGNHDPAFLERYARRALERQLRERFGDEAMEGAFAEDGSFVGRPEIAWDNPIAREIARAEYRDGGIDALIALDPRYEAYRGYDAGSKTAGFDNHLLPPGYADYLRAERDYDLLREMQKPGSEATLTDPRLAAVLEGDVPFSRYANLGTEYYPRFYGQGVMNALSSGTESPVGMGLNTTMTVPNAIYYSADPGGDYLTERVPGAAAKAVRELGRQATNRALGRELPFADLPVGVGEGEKQRAVAAEQDRREASAPATGTDFVRNLTGLNTPPVVGQIADFAVSYLDGTPIIGGAFDLASTAAQATRAGKSAARAMGKVLATDAAIDTGVEGAITGMLPALPRTWSDYLFKPETERQAAAPEVIDKAARADDPEFNYGTTTGARDLVHGSFLSPGTQLPREQRQEAYRASPDRLREMIKQKRDRDAKRAPTFEAADFMGGMKY